eukprot:gene2333-2647_t
MKSIFIILVAVAVVSAVRVRVEQDDIETQFKNWMQHHERNYESPAEYYSRLSNFISNLEAIEHLNTKHQGRATFGANKFSDLSKDEFRTRYLNYKPNQNKPIRDSKPFQYSADIPTQVDWRNKGFVTPVKDQAACGSCWAFSAGEQIETANIMAGNVEQIVSEQQIVDCDTMDGGCGGGDPMNAYQYVTNAGGIASDASYPYTAADGNCYANNTAKVVQINGYGYASTKGNETEFKQAIAARGPLSICVDAETWMSYQSGVVNTNCPDSLDHCVQVVGYDVDESQPNAPVPYYIVRNSWGVSWGQSGYIFIGEGQNLCGITDEVTYVDVATINY